MSRKIKKESDGSYTLSLNLKFKAGTSMLSQEEQIQEAMNALGLEATLLALKGFDTDGRKIEVKGRQLTSKGEVKKKSKRPTDKG